MSGCASEPKILATLVKRQQLVCEHGGPVAHQLPSWSLDCSPCCCINVHMAACSGVPMQDVQYQIAVPKTSRSRVSGKSPASKWRRQRGRHCTRSCCISKPQMAPVARVHSGAGSLPLVTARLLPAVETFSRNSLFLECHSHT